MLTQTPPMLLYSMQCSINDSDWVLFVVNGQVNTISGVFTGYWTTRGYANSRIANSQTGHLASWSTRRLDNLCTGQVADWTTRGCQRRLCVLSFRSFSGIRETASCPVCDLSSPRVGNPRVGVSASCPVTSLLCCKLPMGTIQCFYQLRSQTIQLANYSIPYS